MNTETEISIVDTAWCRTKCVMQKFEFNWIIEDFSLLTRLGEFVVNSPKFPDEESQISFNLIFICDYSLNKSSIRLQPHFRRGKKVANLKYIASIVIIAANNEIEYDCCGVFPNYCFIGKVKIPTMMDFIDEEISINCTIHVETDKVFHNMNCQVPKCDLAKDLGVLFDSKELCDVTIKTGDGHELRAHKNILSARSPVFAAMFKHPMKENLESCVTLDAFNHVVVNDILNFIYTGKLSKLSDMSEDLLAAADTYSIERLKSLCAAYLSENLSVETAPNIYRLADLYHVPDLKIKAKLFLESHFLEICKTVKPEDLITIYGPLVKGTSREKWIFDTKILFLALNIAGMLLHNL